MRLLINILIHKSYLINFKLLKKLFTISNSFIILILNISESNEGNILAYTSSISLYFYSIANFRFLYYLKI